MQAARDRLRNRYVKKPSNSQIKSTDDDSGSEEKKEVKTERIWHHTINEKVNKKALDKFDVSTSKNASIDLQAEMEKYLGGDDEVLQGFLESDDDSMPSFDTLNALKQ